MPNAAEIIGPHPDSSSMELFMRTVLPPPQHDPSHAPVLITVHGPDRPGMVAAVSRSVFEAGGNLTTGKMIKLGGEFAVMMHVECPPERVGQAGSIGQTFIRLSFTFMQLRKHLADHSYHWLTDEGEPP